VKESALLVKNIFREKIGALAIISAFVFPMIAQAEGGISIQGTRIIYPLDARQIGLSINNSSAVDSFLVQSWVEDAGGKKTDDFVATPPLYLSKPHNENLLRLVRVGHAMPKDRESLYYFTAKAIPSVNDKLAGQSVIHIATATRIKLFVRPQGLMPLPEHAASMLSFRRAGDQLIINNPTPYYLTLTDMKVGSHLLGGGMAAPFSSLKVSLPKGAVSSFAFRTINDYGSLTPPVTIYLHRS
jgi:fimbrial chaperone protein